MKVTKEKMINLELPPMMKQEMMKATNHQITTLEVIIHQPTEAIQMLLIRVLVKMIHIETMNRSIAPL
jgi:hypothetical protein